jgi:ketosteroid isomerase-like protein
MKLRSLAVLAVLLAVPSYASAKEPSEAEEQGRIAKLLHEIVDAAQKKELDRLDSYHWYSPKFSKFDDDLLRRQDAAASRKGERDGLVAMKSITARIDDLKVDLFGSVAVATFLLKYDIDMGKEKASGIDRSTVVFAKDDGRWKIVHEHHSPLKTP